MSKYLLVVFLSVVFCFGYEKSMLISDYDFTNQNFNLKDATGFIRHYYPQCGLTDYDMKAMVYFCYVEKIGIVTIFAKLQQEQSLIEDGNTATLEARKQAALGCRLYSFYNGAVRDKYWGFVNQVRWGCRILRYNFDDWEYGNEITLEDGDATKKRDYNRVWPMNAATWSLYVYCPSYGVVRGHPWMARGRQFTGNSIFATRFEKYKEQWRKLYGEW